VKKEKKKKKKKKKKKRRTNSARDLIYHISISTTTPSHASAFATLPITHKGRSGPF
jgi:hypothetical protein